ncbi:nuclear hormone receptor FTZ-F1 isoform X2 [Musca domestica]|uniref:Nuclear hormone receptor FTZ-F1 isoform X2 n=1 Tax=Musca domestica TaxID=7370 RepID=A0ABM3V2I9_MUSDO|nr:nuclear hormone receptor FTZ-F1 isoform X2 [Musca domestica]
MEHFSVALLADSAYGNLNNNNSNSNNNNNINNKNNNINTMHHHKDHMLGAGSTPSTTGFMYDSSSAHHHAKPEMTMAKSDYSSFASCIQQSTMLDHRNVAIDANLDAGVSLGALCDLKFGPPSNGGVGGGGGGVGGSPPLMGGGNATTDVESNFKSLPPLITNIEATNLMGVLPKVVGSSGMAVNVPQFAQMLFSREQPPPAPPAQPIQGSYGGHPHHPHIPMKAQEVQNTATETTTRHYLPGPGGGAMTSTGGLLINSNASSEANNEASGETNYVDFAMVGHNHHRGINTANMDAISTTTTTTTASSNNNNNNNNHLTNDSHITTTTATTTTTLRNDNNNNTIHTASNNHNNNNHSTPTTTPTQPPTQPPSQPTSRSQMHSIEELAASSCTPTSSTVAAPNTISSSPTSIGGALKGSNNSSVTATAVPSANDQQQQQQPQSQNSLGNSPSGAATSQPTTSQQHQQHQQQQQHHLLNSSNISTDSNDDDSMSSSDEYIDMDFNDRTGYQDTTSSHSQQSANGGAGGNSQNNAAAAGGMALINGVVTLNTAQNSAVNSGGGNGGSSASSASGTYMSLLPPATSSSAPHLGVSHMGGGGGGGTSATASGSTPDVIDFKHLFEELCPVCGDKVSGYHYGLLTCESCKGFFKRTVQNKKVYTCVAERSCHIDKTQRKRCPYCRFQKCLEVGMKLEAVRADRMRGGRNKFGPMYKRDRARKLQVSSLTQSPDSSPSPIAIALGQVNASTGVIATPLNGSGGSAGGGGGGGGGGNNGSSNNNNSTSDGINRVGSGGGSGNCHDTGTGSLQNASDSKLCFDSGTHPSSTADSIIEPLRVSPMIREFVQSIDDREWQTQLFALLQKQTYNQVEVDLFELMCKVLDQNLFSQVDWARNTVFFKDLKVDDQMKLLQHSWSDMLVLDHLHQRIHNGLPDETQLNNGQVFNLLSLGLLGVPQLSDYFNELQNKLQDLKFDMGDYVCMKFLILLNPDVRGIINKKTVLQGHENVQAALLDYTLTCYPSVTDKFRRLLSILPDIHAMATRGEEHLYSKHCAGSAPTQTLLMEMLHAKRKV